jgi:4-hydroxyphenylpyruvate dioxygenase
MIRWWELAAGRGSLGRRGTMAAIAAAALILVASPAPSRAFVQQQWQWQKIGNGASPSPSSSSSSSSNLFGFRSRTRSRVLGTLAAEKVAIAEVSSSLSPSFRRENPMNDKFEMHSFHHIEFFCGDASSASRRFSAALGMPVVAKSDQSTGNQSHASYVIQSGDLRLLFTAPYGLPVAEGGGSTTAIGSPIPSFRAEDAVKFCAEHGLAARAVGIEVTDATAAYQACIAGGGTGVLPPTQLADPTGRSGCVISEVALYGDVVLRFISHHSGGGSAFLPGFEAVERAPDAPTLDFGLRRVDHAVGNVWDLREAVEHVKRMTGMHEFAEFTAEDVGTVDSGLNSIVLASNNELVLLPLNEPTFGTARKSQIQTYLEQNRGPGLQHLALKTDDIISTLSSMRAQTYMAGFDFMPAPGAEYYQDVPRRVPELTPHQLSKIEELGILADKDDQGILLQIFTKPCGDRPTFFIEIIQRIGCMEEDSNGAVSQRGGCGGFGKGNFASKCWHMRTPTDSD